MKIIIIILMMVSLPAISDHTPRHTALNSAMGTLQSYGINPTILVSNTGLTGDRVSKLDIQSGFSNNGSFILNQGTHTFSNQEFYVNGYWTKGISDGNGLKFGVVSTTNSWKDYAGPTTVYWDDDFAGSYSKFTSSVKNYSNDDLFISNDNVLSSIGDGIGGVVSDKAKELKPIIRAMGLQTAASDLGRSISIEGLCDGQNRLGIACLNVGKKFASISGEIVPTSGIISEDNVVYQGNTWYRDFDAVPWWGSTDADTRLGIYRLRKADGSWRMETRATGVYMRDWNEIHTDTGHGWSPEVNHATVYNDNLDAIGDLTDALITLDGETFGDIFTE